MILLYSSDSRPLYKEDIQAVTSLPNEYSFHFRYSEAYVSPNVKDRYKSLEGSKAVIIFSRYKDNGKQNLELIPIRLSTIRKVEYIQKTRLYHVFFTLEEFVDLEEDPFFLEENPANDIFFGQQVIQLKFKKVEWSEKIEAINHYIRSLYFHISLLEEKEPKPTEFKPAIDPHTYESFYRIVEGKSYLLEMSIADYNSEEINSEIRAEIHGEDIKTSLNKTIRLGLKLDDRFYEISGLKLGDLKSPVNVLKLEAFNLCKGKTFYELNIPFKVKKDRTRFWSYLLVTFILFLGGGLIALDPMKDNFSGINPWLKLFGLFLTSAATALLYYRFNKK